VRSSAFALQGSPLGVQSVVIFQGLCTMRTERFSLRQAEDPFPHFAAVGGVSRFIFQSRNQ
jgi:hypothetical protein